MRVNNRSGGRERRIKTENPGFPAWIKGQNQFLTLIEADGIRHFKAYVADRLDGPWHPLADNFEHPFAGKAIIRPADGVDPWMDNISHGELLRDGYNQRLEIDPDHWAFLFQGLLEDDKSGKGYGEYPWRLGLLKPDTYPAR